MWLPINIASDRTCSDRGQGRPITISWTIGDSLVEENLKLLRLHLTTGNGLPTITNIMKNQINPQNVTAVTNMISRRNLVAVFVIILLSGCVGLSPDGDITVTSRHSDSETKHEVPTTQSKSIQTKIPNHEYVYYEFSVNQPRILEYSISSERNVSFDIFITDEENFQNFHERSPWNYYETGSSMKTTMAKNSFMLGTDRTYYFVIDNSREGNVTTIPSNRSPLRVSGEIRLKSAN